MHARKLFAGLAASAVAVTALALQASPAAAAVDPDDTTFVPVPADLVGVGSDTSQHALKLAAEAWNATTPAPAFRIATFAATGGGDVTPLQGVTFARPNGSGAGKKTLYGAGNRPEIDFARSSSAQNSDETGAGLQSIPFALDTLGVAVSSTDSNAPATLTGAQILAIYQGTVTNWSQVGGKPGVIAPKIPQGGSGTRSFFEGQLKELNGGAAVVLGAGVAEVQEHDDSQIKNDKNAVAPFSIGRAGLLGNTLRLPSGWTAKRALYNVVRGTSLGDAAIQGAFGTDGFLCSPAARRLIEQAGFDQLARPSAGGVCGQQTTTATSNFAINEAVATTTKLSVTSTVARQAVLTAKVAGSTSPRGSVSFYDGDTVLAANVPMVSGQAVHKVASAPGARTFRAVFVPEADSIFDGSEGTGTGVVKTSSKMRVKLPKKVKGARTKGTATLTLVGVTGKATGTVKVLLGKKVVGTAKVAGGVAKLTVKGLKKGKNALRVVWAGNAAATGSTVKVTVKRTR